MIISMLLVFSVLSVYGKDHKSSKNYNAHFGDMDLDGNDMIDMEEFQKYFPHAGENVFKKADSDKSGSIDHDEWHEFKDRYGYKCKE